MPNIHIVGEEDLTGACYSREVSGRRKYTGLLLLYVNHELKARGSFEACCAVARLYNV